ncbi:MAG: ROK family protein [Myxococcales bacterium]|jgi:polyphosphate glucokinase
MIPRTLALDIGGTGTKAMVLDAEGNPLGPRVRTRTPQPATPEAVLHTITELVEPLGPFERVSAGFPGVVIDGVTRTAHNLDPAWSGFPLAQVLEARLGRPARILNDAGVQGYGIVEGRGVEMLLTLGTGMGCALFVDGHYVPNLELAHHPLRSGYTYEEYVGQEALDAIGKRKWNRRIGRVLQQVEPIFNPRRIYLGGGNARYLTLALANHVTVVANTAGLLGGIALWREVR